MAVHKAFLCQIYLDMKDVFLLFVRRTHSILLHFESRILLKQTGGGRAWPTSWRITDDSSRTQSRITTLTFNVAFTIGIHWVPDTASVWVWLCLYGNYTWAEIIWLSDVSGLVSLWRGLHIASLKCATWLSCLLWWAHRHCLLWSWTLSTPRPF